MRFRVHNAALAATTVFSILSNVAAITIDVNDVSSLQAAASTVAHSMMQWYTGNQTGQTPGLLPYPYYWWEAGGVMGSLIDYWYYTGDPTYNHVVEQALLYQASPTDDYMPSNQTRTEGNDDQVFWGFAVMTATEYKFPNPPAGQPQWLALAQGVWNSQQKRWDAEYCKGGLRWQIFTWNNGYDYKNSPSNAGFINLGARLYAYTGNATYGDWTAKAWDWMTSVGLIAAHGGGPGYSVFDGINVPNCTDITIEQWTYSAGMLLNAAAVMWNVTQDPLWEERANGIWSACNVFFTSQKIMWEVACEQTGGYCNTDMQSFKGYFTRFLAASTKWMPSLYDDFVPYFQASAEGAAKACTGTVDGLEGNACGMKWWTGDFDGSYGFGEQMNALQIFQANMIQDVGYPVTAKTGGISHGDPSAGTESDEQSLVPLSKITTASRAGAGILTAGLLVVWAGGAWWMCV